MLQAVLFPLSHSLSLFLTLSAAAIVAEIYSEISLLTPTAPVFNERPVKLMGQIQSFLVTQFTTHTHTPSDTHTERDTHTDTRYTSPFLSQIHTNTLLVLQVSAACRSALGFTANLILAPVIGVCTNRRRFYGYTDVQFAILRGLPEELKQCIKRPCPVALRCNWKDIEHPARQTIPSKWQAKAAGQSQPRGGQEAWRQEVTLRRETLGQTREWSQRFFLFFFEKKKIKK